MTPAEDEDVIEALSPDGADPAFGERVRPRRTGRGLHHRETFRPQDLVEGTRELRVPIPQQDVLVFETSGDREVPSLLGDPGEIGPGGRAGDMDPSRGKLDEEQERRASSGTRFPP